MNISMNNPSAFHNSSYYVKRAPTHEEADFPPSFHGIAPLLADMPLFFLLLLLGLLVHPTNALNASHIAVEFVDDAQSCTSMKLIASNMQVTCNNGDGSSADCQGGDEAEITGDRK